MTFHRIIYDGDYEDEQTVGDYDMGDFDLITFWNGIKYEGYIPENVRLYIREGDEELPQASLLANPISWWIFSERLLEHVWHLIKKDVQVFDVPIYIKSDGKKVHGYKLINPICVLDGLDWERSEIIRDDDEEIMYINKIYVKKDKVDDHHLFRLNGYLYAVIVSDKLAQSLVGHGFKGIAFIRCGTS